MNRIRPQLKALQAVLLQTTPRGPIPPALTADVDALIRAIGRKAGFAEMHMALLSGVQWERVDEIGRRPAGMADPARLSIPLSEASLIIEHPGAVVDHVYLAFDGLIAALVNMTDTLGRLLNLAYTLGLDPRRASLRAVRDQCTATSSLGVVLHDQQYTGWLIKVRDLRGRCQHADVEDTLVNSAAPLGRRQQPVVDQAYCWKSPAQPTPLAVYAQEALNATVACVDASIRAVLANPSNPTK
jgi:hypothetical protein